MGAVPAYVSLVRESEGTPVFRGHSQGPQELTCLVSR